MGFLHSFHKERVNFSQTYVQQPPLRNGKVTVIYRVTAIIIKVNFAENIRQLKILGSCRDRNIQVTAIYRAVIYWFVFTGMTSFQGLI